VGWIAGLVNALPEESVLLFDLCQRRPPQETFALYRWFLPVYKWNGA